jgi:hypothetical protein
MQLENEVTPERVRWGTGWGAWSARDRRERRRDGSATLARSRALVGVRAERRGRDWRLDRQPRRARDAGARRLGRCAVGGDRARARALGSRRERRRESGRARHRDDGPAPRRLRACDGALPRRYTRGGRAVGDPHRRDRGGRGDRPREDGTRALRLVPHARALASSAWSSSRSSPSSAERSVSGSGRASASSSPQRRTTRRCCDEHARLGDPAARPSRGRGPLRRRAGPPSARADLARRDRDRRRRARRCARLVPRRRAGPARGAQAAGRPRADPRRLGARVPRARQHARRALVVPHRRRAHPRGHCPRCARARRARTSALARDGLRARLPRQHARRRQRRGARRPRRREPRRACARHQRVRHRERARLCLRLPRRPRTSQLGSVAPTSCVLAPRTSSSCVRWRGTFFESIGTSSRSVRGLYDAPEAPLPSSEASR